MSRARRFTAILALAALAAVCWSDPAAGTDDDRDRDKSFPALEQLERDLKALVEINRRSVVRVVARSRLEKLLENIGEVEIDRMHAPITQRIGSGVVLDRSGHVVTLASVVTGSDEVMIVPNGGDELTASIRGIDEVSGLSILAVQRPEALEPVEFGDSDGLEVGSVVTALAGPAGEHPSYTLGFVSGTGISTGRSRRGSYIRLDAASRPGSGGAAVFDRQGRFVGLVFGAQVDRRADAVTWEQAFDVDLDEAGLLKALHRAGEIGGGVSYAVPGNVVRRVSRQLIDSGEVKRSWIGITLEEGEAGRVKLIDVQAGSPADQAGLIKGDTLISLNGEPLTLSAVQIDEIVINPPGTRVNVDIRRGDKVLTLPLELGAPPQQRRRAPRHSIHSAHPVLGVRVEDADASLRTSLGAPPDRGMIVRQVYPGSRAAAAGLRPDDLIVEALGIPARTVHDLHRALDRQPPDEMMEMMILRSGRSLVLQVPPPPAPPDSPAPPAPTAPPSPEHH